MISVIDTHAHLDHVKDLEEALKSASDAGVKAIIAPGVDLESNRKNLEIKEKFQKPKIYVALGLHPGNIKTEDIEKTFDFIKANVGQAIAIGETGLDYWYRWVRKNDEKKQEQRSVFRRQLELSKEADLPVIIHSRGAWKDCLAITKEMSILKAVFHWYSGPADILKEILDSGYYVSCTPSIAYSPEARAAMEYAPIERTLIETDSPVYFKEGEGGFYAQPKNVLNTLKIYVGIKNVDQEKALVVLNDNAKKFFSLN